MKRRQRCRHCGVRNGSRPRGLCYRCFMDLTIRVLYVPQRPFYARLVNKPAPLAGEPTSFLPGTPEKIEIMRQRASRHEQIFHPLDGLLTDDANIRPHLSRSPQGGITLSGRRGRKPWRLRLWDREQSFLINCGYFATYAEASQERRRILEARKNDEKTAA